MKKQKQNQQLKKQKGLIKSLRKKKWKKKLQIKTTTKKNWKILRKMLLK